MEFIAILALGILSGQIASVLYGGYSLGALGNAIAGVTGALFLGKLLSVILGISTYLAMFAGGAVGTLLILIVFSAAESLMSKKKRLF
jgi:uncharacterized membrane protein YeaQ/YmgE (transglycosylase-associated protein family)